VKRTLIGHSTVNDSLAKARATHTAHSSRTDTHTHAADGVTSPAVGARRHRQRTRDRNEQAHTRTHLCRICLLASWPKRAKCRGETG
jgi:hypothetical protein